MTHLYQDRIEISTGDLTKHVSIIDPAIDCRWDEFVNNHENGTIFHTSAWAKVVEETYGYLPYYFVLENDDGEIKAALPLFLIRSRLTGNRLVCLPFSDYCYPLGNNLADISLLINLAKEKVEMGGASYLEIRNWQNDVVPISWDMTTRNYNLLYLLDLQPGVDILKARLHDSVRRGIRQAEKRGVQIRRINSADELSLFYELNVSTRKKLGVLPQPHDFFKSIYDNLILKDLGFTILAEWEGKIIAGVIFLMYKDTIYYKFNASNKKFLQQRPNHLIIWEAIKYACSNGYKMFDFGRCAPEEEGLRIFKSRWGAKEINLPYYYYPSIKGFTSVSESSFQYRTMKLLSNLMPQFIFKITGSILYKHLA